MADIVAALLTGPAWSNLLILAGLLWAVLAVCDLLNQPGSPLLPSAGSGTWSGGDTAAGSFRPALAGPAGPAGGWHFVGPQLLVAAGFWLSGSVDTIWLIGVVAAVAALCVLALRRLGTVDGGTDTGSGPARAAVLATAVLLQVGALLTVRLAVVPDPADPFGAGLSGPAWEVGRGALAMPLLGIAVVLAALGLPAARRARPERSSGRGRERVSGRGPGHVPGYAPGWSTRPSTPDAGAGSRLGRWIDSLAGHDQADAAPRPTAGVRRTRPALVGTGVAVLVTVPFALPLLGDSGPGAALTFQGIATPEFGKLLFVVVLALLAARHSHRFGGAAGPGRAALGRYAGLSRRALPVLRVWWRARRFVIYPLGLFTLVAAVSGALRQDFGTVVSVLCATVGITWAATRHAVQQAPDLRSGAWYHRLGRRLGRMAAGYRPFLLPGGGLLLVTAFIAWFATDYVSERGRVWTDPWRFRWTAGCLPPDPAFAPPGIPEGFVACQRSLLADAESERSQMAQALATVADGGVWGRGLADTASGALPAGSTDFVLVVMWNKLGGLVVVAAVVLVILLGAALRQVAGRTRVPVGGGPGVPALVAAGFAAMLVGQCLFVLASTLNLLPHSGVPAPFLSRGGQSNLALLWGVLLVLGLSLARSGGPGPHHLPGAHHGYAAGQHPRPAPGAGARVGAGAGAWSPSGPLAPRRSRPGPGQVGSCCCAASTVEGPSSRRSRSASPSPPWRHSCRIRRRVCSTAGCPRRTASTVRPVPRTG